MTGLIDIASYVPRTFLSLSAAAQTLGQRGGFGSRSVASFDEDTTTMAVEAVRRLARIDPHNVDSLWFASTNPAYGIKTNAAAIHAALRMEPSTPAFDAGSSLRSGFGALRAAAGQSGIAVLSDMWSGLPGGEDERCGGDAAVAFHFGDGPDAIAVIEAWESLTMELLERWGAPGSDMQSWDDRFGAEALGSNLANFVERLFSNGADAVVLSSINERSAAVISARSGKAAIDAPLGIGFAGVADVGLRLIGALEKSSEGDKIVILLVGDGVESLVLRVSKGISQWQARRTSLKPADKREVSYADFLSWRGRLSRQTPRRPEPQQPAAPPSFRNVGWKFALCAGRCANCETVHAPPEPRCRGCGSVDSMDDVSLSDEKGSVVTFTVDNLAYTPAPPLILAVIDFEIGARASFEVTDIERDELSIGDKVEMVFRKLNTVGGIHNYFWKVRPIAR